MFWLTIEPLKFDSARRALLAFIIYVLINYGFTQISWKTH